MIPDKKELNAAAARALMSLIKLTEALEEDGCIVSTEGSVSTALLPEIMAAAAAKAKQAGCKEDAVDKAVFTIVDIKDDKSRKAFADAVNEGAENITTSGEEPEALKILKEFDAKVLERDKDFYRKRGGSDTGLSDMYEETVNVLTTIMLKG